jgi:hypothetical protein
MIVCSSSAEVRPEHAFVRSFASLIVSAVPATRGFEEVSAATGSRHDLVSVQGWGGGVEPTVDFLQVVVGIGLGKDASRAGDAVLVLAWWGDA